MLKAEKRVAEAKLEKVMAASEATIKHVTADAVNFESYHAI